MDLKGSLVDTKLRIYPSETFTNFLKTIKITKETPTNIINFINGTESNDVNQGSKKNSFKTKSLELNSDDLEKLNKVKEFVNKNAPKEADSKEKTVKNASKEEKTSSDEKLKKVKDFINKNGPREADSKEKTVKKASKEENTSSDEKSADTEECKTEDSQNDSDNNQKEKREGPFLTTEDLDWLYAFIQKQRSKNENMPYLHELFEGSSIETPNNSVIKRNPALEARCVKLRAQQEAREYRKMTKGVDNVRMRFPEETIAYQLKQINRQLIAIGQFIISIFAGFLFGFRGIEWMVGTLDMGFRMLLGVMCALIIALAEIYFLAKKLNEELSIPETVQLGGPPKFADDAKFPNDMYRVDNPKITNKEHQE